MWLTFTNSNYGVITNWSLILHNNPFLLDQALNLDLRSGAFAVGSISALALEL